MRGSGKQCGWLVLAAVMALATTAWGQAKVGDDLSLNLSGNAQFGYLGTFDDVGSTGLNYGFDGNLKGFYYDPRFLQFRVSPYYNQSRFNSNYNSITGASGVTAGVNLFSGSIHPVDVSYDFSHNSEGQFNFPGTPQAYETVGNSSDFNISGALLLPGKPTLQGAFGTSSTSYDVLGVLSGGTGRSRYFNLGSGYDLAGFHLAGSYNNIHIEAETPAITDPSQSIFQNTDQNTLQFSANRQLFKSSTFSFNLAHSNLNADYSGYLTDATYNTVSANLNMSPVQKLTINAGMNYSSNLSAQILSGLLTGKSVGTGTLPVEFASNYLEYGARAAYSVTHEFTVDGHVDHRVQSFPNFPDTSMNELGGGVRYTRAVLGGQMGAYGGIFHYSTGGVVLNGLTAATALSNTGYLGSMSYSHRLSRWQMTGSAQYSRNSNTAIVGYTQTGYGFGFNAARTVGGWNMALSTNLSKSHIDGLNNTDSLVNSYNASFSRNRLSLFGNYSRNNGNSLQVGGNLVPVPVPTPIPNLLVFYNGSSYGGGAAYTKRRLRISGNYAHTSYLTNNFLASQSENSFDRLDIQSQYLYRQLSFTGGFGYVSQTMGMASSLPGTIKTVYFGVSRHFDIF